MTDERIQELIEQATEHFAAAQIDGRPGALDELMGEACSKHLQAAACLNVARACLRTGNAEGGVQAVRKWRENTVAALAAMKCGGELYAPPQGGLIH